VQIEVASFAFHCGRFLADALQTQVLDQPDRGSNKEVGHVLAPYRHDEITKSVPIQVDQRLAMLALFCSHRFEHRSRCRVVGPQLLGISRIDRAVFFFRGDRKCEHFAFCQFFEALLSSKAKQRSIAKHRNVLSFVREGGVCADLPISAKLGTLYPVCQVSMARPRASNGFLNWILWRRMIRGPTSASRIQRC
jgi:hypothetical protein